MSREQIVPITGARVGLSEDQRLRTRRYLISMSIRTVCFIGAIIATGWLCIIFFLDLFRGLRDSTR